MKERPILFSGPMVRAILDGTKTQTRRVLKPQPLYEWVARECEKGSRNFLKCPYGQPGDRLWVRENGWERPARTERDMREGADTWPKYCYDADYLHSPVKNDEAAQLKAWGFKRRPSIHMPRWASRITLEVTGVRVERLQDISDDDAEAEGCERPPNPIGPGFMAQVYRGVWESINGPGSWDANPYVWVVSFRRIDAG